MVIAVTTKTTTNVPHKDKENVCMDLAAEVLQVGSPPKRHLAEMQGDDTLETPPRDAKKWKQQQGGEDDDDAAGQWQQWEAPVLAKKRREIC